MSTDHKLSTTELSSEGIVKVERNGFVGVLTLNRPEARNAINHSLSLALGSALASLDADPGVRAIVIQGAGSAFCAGQDLKALGAGEPLCVPEHPEWGYAGIVRHRIDTPTIAAVHGYAFGGGLEIILACDLVVLGASARLGLPEVTLGLFAAAGGVPRIAQQVPPKVAARMVLTGSPIDAAEAERWGLVSEVAPDDAVQARALEIAERIAANGPVAVQASKRILRDLAFANTWGAEAWPTVEDEISHVFSSADAAEGVRAFREKRAPIWRGC